MGTGVAQQQEEEKDCPQLKGELEVCGTSREGTHSFPLADFQEGSSVSIGNNSKVALQAWLHSEHLSPPGSPHTRSHNNPNTIRFQGTGWGDKSRSITGSTKGLWKGGEGFIHSV